MSNATCAHCDVLISDHSTMVERDGRTFCCTNCANAMGVGAAQGGAAGSAWDH